MGDGLLKRICFCYNLSRNECSRFSTLQDRRSNSLHSDHLRGSFVDITESRNRGIAQRGQKEQKGVFTRERKPKMAAHYLRERWMAIPDFEYKK
jgi:hypothetical protein